MNKELHIIGPPGTGKTTYLAKQIEKAAEKYDPSLVLVCSFTRAAVSELNRRQLPIPEENVGTLHSLAYRSLDHPEICETKKGLQAFSEEHPRYALTGGTREAIDDGMTSQGEGKGDKYLMEYSRLRALMRPRAVWPSALSNFATVWEDYKRQTASMDFTDLIEIALRDVERPSCYPMIGFFDECQDFSALEIALVRKWAQGMEQAVLVYDPAQSIYRFKGAAPEAVYDQSKVFTTLKQSYRLPAAVRTAAETLIGRAGIGRDYADRGENGTVRKETFTYHDADRILDIALPYVEEYKSVLVLTSCGYMLTPLLEELRRQGIPFANPFRRKRRDWNPLHKVKDKCGAGERVAAFLAAFNREPRQWMLEEVLKWLPLTKGITRKGWQEYTKVLSTEKLLTTHDLLGIIEAEDLDHALSPAGLWWLETKLNSQWSRTATYAIRVGMREPLGLIEEPLLNVGTIHCSPPGEKILTTWGYVNIENLTEGLHRLPSYQRNTNSLIWGWKRSKELGYNFTIKKGRYKGDIISIHTEKSQTKITPHHHLLARFNENFMEKYVVYLMRRDDWWRIGFCTSAHRPYRSGGIGGRLATEQADVGWILGVYNTRREAWIAEEIFRGKYGITGLTFESAKNRMFTNEELHKIHEEINNETTRRAYNLLHELGLNEKCPLYSRAPLNGEVEKRNMRSIFKTEAANLVNLSNYVDVLTLPDGFVEVGRNQIWGSIGNRSDGKWSPTFSEAEIKRENYEGCIYGINVPPHHYYISGGQVVHNSTKGGEADVVILFPDVSPQGFMEITDSREGMNAAIRQFYVGMTRAKETLIWGESAGRLAFPWREV